MNRISTLTLHRYRLGELSPDEAAAVRAALEANPAEAARYRAQEALRAEFALRPVPPAIRALSAPRARWSLWGLPALAAAAALTLVVLLPSPPPLSEDTRLKGLSSRVDVLVEGRGVLDPGEALHPGDRVQIRVPAGAHVEAWVGEGRRVLGRFDTATDHPTLAPFALTLDEAPGDEQMVILLADRHLQPGSVPALLEGELPRGVERLTVRLPKVR